MVATLRTALLRGLRGAGACAAAGLAVSTLQEHRSWCLSQDPPPAVAEAHSLVKAQLSRTGVPDEAMRPLKLALKGGRISASITLADDRAVLPALLPLLREFPAVRWRAEAEGSALGQSLVLQRSHVQPAEAAASISVILPDRRSSTCDRFRSEASELEFIGGAALSTPEAVALAGSLAAVHRTIASRPQQHLQQQSPRPDLADALEGLFGGHRLGSSGPGGPPASQKGGDPVARLEALGVSVHTGATSGEDDWGALAGGEAVRQALDEALLLPLQQPEVYEQVMAGTRARPRAAHAKSILFEGPPGTGKTSTSRILAAKLGVPLVYLPLESVVSKWYGEAEQRLAAVFDACAEMGATVIFLDEIDALATSRDDGGMHEASRRSLSVLLRKLDGFEANKSTVLIGATNRPQDLDAALLSRFELSVQFPLPEADARRGIFALYARHLRQADLDQLSSLSGGASGRDIRDVCEAAERRWAARRVRQEPQTAGQPLPPAQEYAACLEERQKTREQYALRRSWR